MAVRIPVRIVVLVLVVPVRMVWDLLVAGGKGFHRVVLTPLGRPLVWLGRVLIVVPLVWSYDALLVPLWRYVVVPLVRYGLVVPVVWFFRSVLTPLAQALGWLLRVLVGTPSVWLYETLLTPLGRGVMWVAAALFVWPWAALWRYVMVPLVRYGVVVPVVWFFRSVLTPIGHGLAFAVRAAWALVVRLALVLLVAPVGWLWRRVLAPVGREIGAAFAVAWRIAGGVSRAAGRALAWLAWNVVGRPGRWTYRNVCVPVGQRVRDSVIVPARKAALTAGRVTRETLGSVRETFRQTRRDAWRALVGRPPEPEPVEPTEHRARTLGSTTTAPGAVPAPETTSRKRG